MRFRSLLWLALFPVLAASAATRVGLHPESRAPLGRLDASSASEHHDIALRPGSAAAMQVVARPRHAPGPAGPGSLRTTPLAQGISSREVECTAVRLATWQTSHATVAHGGLLIYFPTAPPLHG